MTDRQPPHVVVTHNGTATKLKLREGAPIDQTPITGLGQVVTVGDTAQRSDQRTPQVIWTDQRGGMGLGEYVEVEGNTAYLDGDLDVRFGVFTLPPAATYLGAHGLLSGTPAVPSFVEYLGVTNAYVIAWVYGNSSTTSARRNSTGTTWATITTGGTGVSNLTGYTYFNGYYLFATTNNTKGLYTSADGVTWADSAKAKACIGLAVHDNKIWTFNNTDKTLDRHTDPTAAHASWTTSAALYLHPGETVRQVVTWRDASGREAVYLVSTRRIIWYDEDADTFLDFYRMGDLVGATTSYPRLAISPADGNAYLTMYDTATGAPSDTAVQFSGVATTIGPNHRGGLYAGKVDLIAAVGNTRWMFFACAPRSPNTTGRVLALNESGGFTALYRAANAVYGIGYGRGKVFVLDGTGCQEIGAPDTSEHPLFASRTYQTGTTYYHEFSMTDGGTPHMTKLADWIEIHARRNVAGVIFDQLSANATLIVSQREVLGGNWVPAGLGTYPGASTTFPLRIDLATAGNPDFRQFGLRIGLSSVDSADPAVIEAVALAFLRREVPRYAYTLTADLRSLEKQPLYAGRDLAELMARVDAWTQPGAVVRLDFAGGDWASKPDNAVTVANATVAYRAQLDPDKGPQQLTLVFSDVTPPASG